MNHQLELNWERSGWPKLDLDKYKFWRGRHTSALELELDQLRREIAFMEVRIRLLKKPLNEATIRAFEEIMRARGEAYTE